MTKQDREWAFLSEQTGMSAPFNDMYYNYLRQQGFSGTLQDMIAKSGWGLTPSKGGPIFLEETENLVARFSNAPTNERKILINTLIKSLKDGGVWDKLDTLYVMAAADAQAAQRNWIADQYNLTPVSSPVFTADRGYQGDGVSSHITTNFNASTALSPKYVQNSASFGFWVRNEVANNSMFDMGGGAMSLNARNAGAGAPRGLINDASTATWGAQPTSIGLHAMNRSGANARQNYYNGALNGSDTAASTGVPTGASALLTLAGPVNPSTRQQAAAFIGGSLTASEHNTLYQALKAYLEAVGAA